MRTNKLGLFLSFFYIQKLPQIFKIIFQSNSSQSWFAIALWIIFPMDYYLPTEDELTNSSTLPKKEFLRFRIGDWIFQR